MPWYVAKVARKSVRNVVEYSLQAALKPAEPTELAAGLLSVTPSPFEARG